VFLLLGKNQFPVSHDFKNAAPGFDQFRLHPNFILDRLCQTGSRGIVVSIVTVFDGNTLNHNLSFPGNDRSILTFPRDPFNKPSPPKTQGVSFLCKPALPESIFPFPSRLLAIKQLRPSHEGHGECPLTICPRNFLPLQEGYYHARRSIPRISSNPRIGTGFSIKGTSSMTASASGARSDSWTPTSRSRVGQPRS